MQKYERPDLELTSLMTQEKMAGPSDYLYEDEDEFEAIDD